MWSFKFSMNCKLTWFLIDNNKRQEKFENFENIIKSYVDKLHTYAYTHARTYTRTHTHTHIYIYIRLNGAVKQANYTSAEGEKPSVTPQQCYLLAEDEDPYCLIMGSCWLNSL